MASLQYDGFTGRSASNIMAPRRPKSRTQSISSDKPSTVGHGFVSIPTSVSPQPAFIAASAASQIVTNDHDSHADAWYDESGMLTAGETALVSEPALQLVNNFLDQLLFNFLQLSKATTLSALRPAVTEVLKPKLAKDAINNADEELQEYLGGADEEDYVLPQGADPSRDWDLELVWKRTRLRCMVYSSLGDVEEEDEDLYMEQENLEIGADEQISDVISPAVAIFLTSVLEYMGELTLTVAGQAAYQRVRANFERELKDGSRTMADIAERIVVEEGDMERVALDRTLGRLWRGWKKRIRTPTPMELGLRSFSRASFGRQDSTPTDTFGHQSPEAIEETVNDLEEGGEATIPEEKAKNPAEIPLPIGLNDVDEIEIPGLAHNSDNEVEDEDENSSRPPRPKSMLMGMVPQRAVDVPPAGSLHDLGHKRSTSLPVSRPSRFSIPVSQQLDEVSSDDGSSNYEDGIEQPVSDLSTPAVEREEQESTEFPRQGHRNRSAMIIANTSFGPLVQKQEAQSVEQEDEMAITYEKAEIMTSSRVSVASSSPPSSERSFKRSGSVRSARIVDIHGPRSPRMSQSPSMDGAERGRPSSITLRNGSSTPPIPEESAKPKQAGVPSGAGGFLASASGSTPAQPQMSARITGFDEEIPDPVALVEDTDLRPSHSANASYAEGTARNSGRHVPHGQSARVPPSSSRQHGQPPSAKISVHTGGQYSNGFIDEPIPEIPSRASGHSSRHAPRSNSIGKPSLGSSAMIESDSGAPPLLGQNNTPSRATHTSGSSTSSATSRVKAVRMSEEHNSSHADSVARNFEELIHSDQTITYTLTPEHMRDMNVRDSPSLL